MDVPPADIAPEPAEIEHLGHILHPAHVPCADIAVEMAFREHPRHVGDMADIPPADVSVERAELAEKFVHVRNRGRVDAIEVRTISLALDFGPDGVSQLLLRLGEILVIHASYDIVLILQFKYPVSSHLPPSLQVFHTA